MFSTVQKQCLQQLGVPLYQLKPEISDRESMQDSILDWTQVSDAFIADIKVLFPLAELTEQGMKLTKELNWQLSSGSQIVISNDTLYSPVPSSLSLELKRELWATLAKLLGNSSSG